jgi:hypothetical protein
VSTRIPKISKRTREEAIRICDVAASTPGDRRTYEHIARTLGHDALGKEYMLAVDAWSYVYRRGVDWTPATDAEAAALLREGWCPGDTVVRRGRS